MIKKFEINLKSQYISTFWSLSITFDINSIYFEQIQTFQLIFEPLELWFCCDTSDSDDEFGSKKSIKSQFYHNIKQNLALDGLDSQSLKDIEDAKGKYFLPLI